MNLRGPLCEACQVDCMYHSGLLFFWSLPKFKPIDFAIGGHGEMLGLTFQRHPTVREVFFRKAVLPPNLPNSACEETPKVAFLGRTKCALPCKTLMALSSFGSSAQGVELASMQQESG